MGSVVNQLLLDLLSLCEDELCESSTDVFSEGFVFLVLILGNGVSDLGEDVFSVDDEIFANVISEGGWAIKDGNHFGELGPVTRYPLASLNFVLHFGNSNGKMLEAIKSCSGIISFEIGDCGRHILEDDLWSSKASLDVIKAFSFDSAQENSFGDCEGLCQLWADCLLLELWNWSELLNQNIGDGFTHIFKVLSRNVLFDFANIVVNWHDVLDGVGKHSRSELLRISEDFSPDLDSLSIGLHTCAVSKINVECLEHLSNDCSSLDDINEILLFKISKCFLE